MTKSLANQMYMKQRVHSYSMQHDNDNGILGLLEEFNKIVDDLEILKNAI